MIAEKRVAERAPFKKRLEAFKEAYFEWARYNPYKVYPLPNRNVIWNRIEKNTEIPEDFVCLLYTSPSPRDPKTSRMPSSA